MLKRRVKCRTQTALPGGAIFAGVGAEAQCVVLNLSERGACVAFAPGVEAPRLFLLRIDPDPLQSVRVVWRRFNTVGVAFVTPRTGVPDVIPG